MASPVDVPSSVSDFIPKSDLFLYSQINNLEKEEIDEVPLQTPWTLWFYNSESGSTAIEFERNLKKVYTFSTIQGFWAVYNNVPDVSNIRSGYSYHLMREERLPMWEEEYNQRGGSWKFTCSKQDTSEVWEELLFAAIGEQFLDAIDPEDEICGLCASIKDKFDVVKIWNVNAQLEKKATVINKVLKLLPDTTFKKPFYKSHNTHSAFGNN